MKFTVLQSNINKALSQVGRIVGSRATLPVLSNVLIIAEKGKLKLSATDLEVAVTSLAKGKIEEDGQLTVPARLLIDFISNNNDESIQFETKKDNDNVLHLKSTHYKAVITGISAEEFPTIPVLPTENIVNIKSEDFADALKKVIIAPANDETRPVLAGIYFQFEGKRLTLAATDSFRLAEKKLSFDQDSGDKKFIVPGRTMTEVLRLMSGTEAIKTVEISSTENQIAFKIGETEVVSRLIEGAFPNYTQIIPTSSKIKATLNHAEFVSAVKMSALFAKNAANNIRIQVKKNEALISSLASPAGESTSKISAETSGGELTIAFNARYVLDVLAVDDGKKVILELNDDATAGIIRSEKDPEFTYIIMPLKLDS